MEFEKRRVELEAEAAAKEAELVKKRKLLDIEEQEAIAQEEDGDDQGSVGNLSGLGSEDPNKKTANYVNGLQPNPGSVVSIHSTCLLYTSDAADE